ncbi:MAG: tetratricopeptide repeat protein [Verrucomicrobiales bacterium]
MKMFLLAASLSFSCMVSEGQVIRGARDYTGRVAPQNPAPQPAAPSYRSATPSAAARPSKQATQVDRDANDQKLFQYQKLRAEKGSETAQYELGLRYLNGKGVEADPAKAREWFEKAAKGGNALAKKQLDLLKSTSIASASASVTNGIPPLSPSSSSSGAKLEKGTVKTKAPNASATKK